MEPCRPTYIFVFINVKKRWLDLSLFIKINCIWSVGFSNTRCYILPNGIIDVHPAQMKRNSHASVVGSLVYAQVCTRPDVAYVVGVWGRYPSNPTIDHRKASKKLMRYLQGTKNFMLLYKRTDNLKVISYFDLD
jgi:hypothetical protein